MKILMFANQSEQQSNGGVESATKIFEALHQYEWVLCTNRKTDRSIRWLNRGAAVYYLNFSDRRARIVRFFALLIQVWHLFLLVVREKPNILHANDVRAALVCIPVSFVCRLPLLFTLRDTKDPYSSYGLQWRLIGFFAKKIITLSSEMAEVVFANFNVTPDRVVDIPSIVDLQVFNKVSNKVKVRLRTTFGIGERQIAVGLVGGVSEKKGQREFIQKCFDPLAREIDSVSLHIFGDFEPKSDAYAASCLEIVNALGLSGKVKFHGYQKDVSACINAMDIVVISSRYEGLARAMIESMACAIPVVSTNVCSAREILDRNGAGVVIEAGDYQSFFEALRTLCLDPIARSKLGDAASKYAHSHFDETVIAKKWKSVYEQSALL